MDTLITIAKVAALIIVAMFIVAVIITDAERDRIEAARERLGRMPEDQD